MNIWHERLKEFIHYRDLLKHLVVRDIKLKYRRSILGYLWSVLDPMLIMIVMTIVFSTMFSRNIDNFPVYLFTGQLLFLYMNTSTTQGMNSIIANGALIKKAYVPKYIFCFAKVTSSLVDFLFTLGALLLVMIFTGAKFSWYNLLFPFVIIQLYVFCIGLSMFLAQANVFFKDVQYIYHAIVTAWMYLTPIFYPIEALPEGVQWAIMHFNPLYFYIRQFRDLIYTGTFPDPFYIICGCATAVGMLVIGMFSFMKNQDRFILYI